jgi:hypothetical protein
MNRATFFKTLGIGLASAPTLAKVLAEEPVPVSPSLPLGWSGTPQDFGNLYIAQMARIQAEMVRRIALTDPYAELFREGGLTADEVRQLAEQPLLRVS